MSKPGTLNELGDLFCFAIAYQALKRKAELEEYGDDRLVAHLQKGKTLGQGISAKRDLALTLSENWKKLEKEGAKITGAKVLFGKATKPTSFVRANEFLGLFSLKILGSNSKFPVSVANEFGVSLNIKTIKKVADLVNSEDLEGALGKLGLLLRGGGKATKRLVAWAKECSAFGTAEGGLIDEIDRGEINTKVGEKLGKAKRKYDNVSDEDGDAKLNAERELAEAEAEANSVISNSNDPEGAKQTIVNSAVKMQADLGFGVNSDTGYAYHTRVGAKYGLNDEQEKMLTAKGKVIMAAGAGSGKTHTLTALIEHMCSPKSQGGEGIRSNQIMVSSFTRAASGEIKERINNKSDVTIPESSKGFGTVHSITGKNISKRKKKQVLSPADRPLGGEYIGQKEGYYIDQLMLLALKQISFTGGRKPPAPTNLFTGNPIEFNPNDVEKGLQELRKRRKKLEGDGKPMTQEILDILKAGYNHHGKSVRDYDNWKSPDNWEARERDQEMKLRPLLNPKFVREERVPGKRFRRAIFNYTPKYNVGDIVSPDDIQIINSVISKLPNFGQFKQMRTVKLGRDTFSKIGSTPQKKTQIKYFKKEDCRWWNQPAGQWFNIGIDLIKDRVSQKEDIKDMDNEEKKAITQILGDAGRIIAVLKGKGISPTEAWYKAGEASDVNQIKQFDPIVAMYAAYEWLLGNTPEVPKDGDMTDMLIDACRVLVKDPATLKSMQNQYKLILVDEAQDLNRVQHLFFGLVAGTIDPSTLEEKPASQMSAKMYAMIGDDKQAIYGFQGADSKEMIGKADVKGGDFQTNLITTNYRSGKNIVDMANQFIAYNEDQIPMVCKANTQVNGMGEVDLHEVTGSGSEGAKSAGASHITDLILEMKEQGKTWSDFGIGVRTNTEGEIYALACLQKEIPFKGRYNPLQLKEYKGVLSHFKLARFVQNGKVEDEHEMLYDLLKYPTSFISTKPFKDYFNTVANPIQDLIKGVYRKKSAFYHTGRNKVSALGKRVDHLADMVKQLINFVKGYGNKAIPSRDLYEFVIGKIDSVQEPDGSMKAVIKGGLKNLKGDGVIQSIIEQIKGSASEVQKLQVLGSEVTEQIIMSAAMSKLSAFSFMLSIGDEMTEEDEDGVQTGGKGTINDLLEFTDQVEGVDLKSPNEDEDSKEEVDAVRIMTCHGWKGLECDTMFVPCGMSWPRSDTTTAKKMSEIQQDSAVMGDDELRNTLVQRENMESERRLMYVAMTRAKQNLHLVHTIAQFETKHGMVDVGSHFFESNEICLEPTKKKSNTKSLMENWGEVMGG